MKFEPEVLAAVITSGVSLVLAAIAALTAYFRSRKAKHEAEEISYQNDALDERLEALEKSRSYVVCPHCGNEIPAMDLEVLYHDPTDQETLLKIVKEVQHGAQKKSSKK